MALEEFTVRNHAPWQDEMAVTMTAKHNCFAGIVYAT